MGSRRDVPAPSDRTADQRGRTRDAREFLGLCIVKRQPVYAFTADAAAVSYTHLIGDGKIDTGKPDQRLNDNYPNLLATGKGDMLEVTVKDGLMTYKNLGLSSDGEKIFETVTLSKDCLLYTSRCV